MTETLRDFMVHRTGSAPAPPGQDCCQPIAVWMGEIRGWDRQRMDREIQAYLDEIALGQRFREGLRGPHREDTADERK
jgi:glycerol-3-phosphate dehydrogenase